jgi:hypothetical protein
MKENTINKLMAFERKIMRKIYTVLQEQKMATVKLNKTNQEINNRTKYNWVY